MKNKKTLIVVSVISVVAIAFSLIVYFDMEENLSWFSFVTWLSGTFFLLREVARSIKKSIPTIRDYDENDLLTSIFVVGIMFTLIFAPIMVSGFGSFEVWDAFCSGGSLDDRPVAFVANYLITLFASFLGVAMILGVAAIIVSVLSALVSRIVCGSDALSDAAMKNADVSLLFPLEFMLLSHFCGAVDYFGFWSEPISNFVSKFK